MTHLSLMPDVKPYLYQLNARVEHMVEQIADQIHDHHGDPKYDRRALDHRVIAPANRLDRDPPDAGDVKQHFDDKRPGHEECRGWPQQRNQRQQRVPKHMPNNHGALEQALWRAPSAHNHRAEPPASMSA